MRNLKRQNADLKGEREIWRYANTWYTNTVGLERLMCLTMDAYRETADRWLRLFNE